MCLVLDGIFDGPMSRKSQNGSNLMIDAEVLTNDGGKAYKFVILLLEKCRALLDTIDHGVEHRSTNINRQGWLTALTYLFLLSAEVQRKVVQRTGHTPSETVIDHPFHRSTSRKCVNVQKIPNIRALVTVHEDQFMDHSGAHYTTATPIDNQYDAPQLPTPPIDTSSVPFPDYVESETSIFVLDQDTAYNALASATPSLEPYDPMIHWSNYSTLSGALGES
ncbi:hypothetical protein BJ912DRAFT_926767 [Pholiota molesta]|nr:hypothetical protein BJ912DRAFT_926767 [Pholiota molesta]